MSDTREAIENIVDADPVAAHPEVFRLNSEANEQV